jgi:hypothetical protein
LGASSVLAQDGSVVGDARVGRFCNFGPFSFYRSGPGAFAEMDFRLPVEKRRLAGIPTAYRFRALNRQRSMIHALADVCAFQRFVLISRPKRTPFAQQVVAVPLTSLDLPQSIRSRLA